MDDIFAGLQPTNGGESGTPPAPVEPAAPVESTAPVEAVTPAAPEAPAEPTAAEKAEDEEWAKVAEDMFPGLGEPNKEGKDGTADATKKPEEVGANKGTQEAAKSGEDADKPGEAGAEKNDDGTEKAPGEDEPAGPPELSPVDRQQLEQSVKTEIQERMFTEELNGKPVVTTPDGSKYYLDANGKPMLADADGDPIRGIDDLMQRINPRTGEPFTEEQAGMYLLHAQNRMRENVVDMQTRIEDIASTGITMKEESETVAWQYGELLKAMPELQKELWSEYEKTLVKDPKTGIVVKAPSSLKRFYEIALEPYAELGRRLEAGGVGAPPVATPPAAKAPDPVVQQERRQQVRQDRSDIYGGGKVDEATDDDKEWGAAAQAVFGDQLKDLRR